MKSPHPETQCAKDVFKIQPLTSGAINNIICNINNSNNISIPQVRANKRETQHDTNCETS